MPFENERNDLIAVGLAPVLVAVALAREEYVLTNASPAAERIKIIHGPPSGATYAASGGVPLLVNSVYFSSAAAGFKPSTSEIWAVSDGAAGVLSVYMRPKADQSGMF